ncbi:MAG: AAA-like domain-containing protein [Phormidesmis sp.]
MPFRLEDAIKIANQAAMNQGDRTLTDVEILVLRGVWERLEYDQIAARGGYATSYLSQDVAPKLWKLLSAALGEKVKKSNFKTVIAQQAKFSNSADTKSPFFPRRPLSATAPISRQYYIQRPSIEQLFYETLLQPGALVRLKAPRFMGKSTLVSQVLSRIEQDNYQVVMLSLEMADRAVHFNDLNRFLRWLCINIGRGLGQENRLGDYWEAEDMGAKVSCTAYLEDYLLAQDRRPLVLCLDDVDLLFPHPQIYEDFFGLLRSWHEKARTREAWAKLRLVIVHSTDVYIRLQMHQSPFNVGQPITLPDFGSEQVMQMAELYKIKIESTELQAIMDLIGGHPALLKQLFNHLKKYPTVSVQQLLAESTTESSLFISHLREQLLTLQTTPALAQAFRAAIASEQPIALPPLPVYQLQSMGLIKLSGNQVEPRCQLYQKYFKERLKSV